MTDQSDFEEGEADDLAPGQSSSRQSGLTSGLSSYVIGLVLAAVLTVGSFLVSVGSSGIWEPAIPAALVALAIGQMGVHLVFFLHLTTGPDNTNNALALAFGILVVVLLIGGSLWIMQHLNANMMPAWQM